MNEKELETIGELVRNFCKISKKKLNSAESITYYVNILDIFTFFEDS